jgi:hypothetical protein
LARGGPLSSNRRSIERQSLSLGFALSLYAPPALIHGTRTCAQLRSHVRRTLVPLSAASLSPLRRSVKLGRSALRVSTPSAPSTGYSSVIASIRSRVSRWGCSPAPGRHACMEYLPASFFLTFLTRSVNLEIPHSVLRCVRTCMAESVGQAWAAGACMHSPGLRSPN